MMLSKLQNINELTHNFQCDLFIVYDGCEDRSSKISNTLSITPKNILIIKNKGEIDYAEKYPDSNVQEIQSGTDISSHIEYLLESFGPKSTVSLDISCLPRETMAEIFVALAVKNSSNSLSLFVFYSLAEFTPPNLEILANESIEPVNRHLAGWSSPETKPTSLVLGLGYEPHQAEGASEYFEPSDQWIFIPKSPIPEFLIQTTKSNSDLLDKTSENRSIEYDLTNPELVYGQLELVVGSLLKTSNPVLLPFGPKIFFFLCLIQCLNHPELGVWRVTGSGNGSTGNIKASNTIIGMHCLLENPPYHITSETSDGEI